MFDPRQHSTVEAFCDWAINSVSMRILSPKKDATWHDLSVEEARKLVKQLQAAITQYEHLEDGLKDL